MKYCATFDLWCLPFWCLAEQSLGYRAAMRPSCFQLSRKFQLNSTCWWKKRICFCVEVRLPKHRMQPGRDLGPFPVIWNGSSTRPSARDSRASEAVQELWQLRTVRLNLRVCIKFVPVDLRWLCTFTHMFHYIPYSYESIWYTIIYTPYYIIKKKNCWCWTHSRYHKTVVYYGYV